MSENDNDDKIVTISALEYKIGAALVMLGMIFWGPAAIYFVDTSLERVFNEQSYLQEKKEIREVTGRCNEQANAETNLKSYERKFYDCYSKDFPPRPITPMR